MRTARYFKRLGEYADMYSSIRITCNTVSIYTDQTYISYISRLDHHLETRIAAAALIR